MNRTKITAVIPTKNVGAIIRPTLESLRFCDEVVIIDMFSTDSTKAVCQSYPNVRFFQRQDYIFGNFNFGAEQASGEWILRLDSDEVVSDELRESIQQVISDSNPPYTNYDASCRLFLFGMQLHHFYGSSDNWRTHLFRKGTARYPLQSEHEALQVTGPTGRLKGKYDHFSTPSISQWVGKYNYYTDLDAERTPSRPPRPRWRIVLDAARFFRGAYLGKGQLHRDGYLGLTVAVMATFGQVLLELKLWERYEKARLQTIGHFPNHPNVGGADRPGAVT